MFLVEVNWLTVILFTLAFDEDIISKQERMRSELLENSWSWKTI